MDLVYHTTPWQQYLVDDARKDPDYREAENQGADRIKAWPDFQSEIYARLYGDAEKIDNITPGLEWAIKAHDLATDLPEWKRLSKRTMGDEFTTQLATPHISKAVFDAMPEDLKQKSNPQELKEGMDALKSLESDDFDPSAAISKMRRQMKQSQQQGQAIADGINESQVRNAIRTAIDAANQSIDAADSALYGFGWDNSDPSNRKGASAGAKSKLASRIVNNRKLRQIAMIAGRMRRIAIHKQRIKTRHGTDQIQDIETGNDIERLLPAELARFASDKMKKLFYRDYLERNTMQYRIDGKEPVGKGPIIMLVDESDSMSGEPEIWAKAVFVGLLEIAQRQNRVCALIPFSSVAGRPHVFIPGKVDASDLVNAVENFMGGGTNWDRALKAACEVIESNKSLRKSDVILVTDGMCKHPGKWWDEIRNEKEIRCFGIAINWSPSKSLKETCDEVLAIADISSGSEDEENLTGRIYSI